MNAEENSMSFSKRADYYRMMKNYHMACEMVQKWLSSVSVEAGVTFQPFGSASLNELGGPDEGNSCLRK
jgi:hypothetical protein